MQPTSTDWWGEIALQPGKNLCCQVGGLTLDLRPLGSEWQLSHHRDETGLESDQAGLTLSEADAPADAGFERLLFSTPASHVHIVPALADRAVVSRPAQPLLLAPGQQATIYVHAPLWLQLRAEANGPALLDMPVAKLSDTWFGLSTREGELCYASRTRARLHSQDIPPRPHRAITPVRLRNNAGDPLRLDKLNLPEPYLALYAADNGLWTDSVELTRAPDGEIAPVHVASGVPPEAVNGRLVCGPRRTTERGGILSSFTALFG